MNLERRKRVVSRFREMKKFNIFLFSVLLLISVIFVTEILTKILDGSGIAADELREYGLVWLSFLCGAAFINLVDFVVVELFERGAKR